MPQRDKIVIALPRFSDAKALTVARSINDVVTLGVVESDANPNVEFDAVPLITASLDAQSAVDLARELLLAAGARDISWRVGLVTERL